jgi:hypothetical protein
MSDKATTAPVKRGRKQKQPGEEKEPRRVIVVRPRTYAIARIISHQTKLKLMQREKIANVVREMLAAFADEVVAQSLEAMRMRKRKSLGAAEIEFASARLNVDQWLAQCESQV